MSLVPCIDRTLVIRELASFSGTLVYISVHNRAYTYEYIHQCVYVDFSQCPFQIEEGGGGKVWLIGCPELDDRGR